jgi:hypothetical protein
MVNSEYAEQYINQFKVIAPGITNVKIQDHFASIAYDISKFFNLDIDFTINFNHNEYNHIQKHTKGSELILDEYNNQEAHFILIQLLDLYNQIFVID